MRQNAFLAQCLRSGIGALCLGIGADGRQMHKMRDAFLGGDSGDAFGTFMLDRVKPVPAGFGQNADAVMPEGGAPMDDPDEDMEERPPAAAGAGKIAEVV